jgi:hypothetical protein
MGGKKAKNGQHSAGPTRDEMIAELRAVLSLLRAYAVEVRLHVAAPARRIRLTIPPGPGAPRT